MNFDIKYTIRKIIYNKINLIIITANSCYENNFKNTWWLGLHERKGDTLTMEQKNIEAKSS